MGGNTATVVSSGGYEVVSSGGTVIDPTIAGGVLELQSGFVVSGAISFAGTGGTLKIDGLAMPSSTISGLMPGDTIELAGLPYSSTGTVNLGAGNELIVTEAAAVGLQLDRSQHFATDAFYLGDDGSGGTDITMAVVPMTISWTNPNGGNWNTAANWSTDTVPGPSDTAVLGGSPTTYTVSATAPITVTSISITNAFATLDIEDPGGTQTISGGLLLSGALLLDRSDAGGTQLNIGGTLGFGSVGGIVIGNSAMTSPTTVTAGGFSGSLNVSLIGGGTAQATLDISAAAPSTLSGGVGISGAATVQFAGGGITSVVNGGGLSLTGPKAFVQDVGQAGNSALAGLSLISGLSPGRAASGVSLQNGVTLVTSVGLTVTDSGALLVDSSAGYGASNITIGGGLTVGGAGSISIGNANLPSPTTVGATSLIGGSGAFVSLTGGSGLFTGSANLDIAGSAPSVLDLSLWMTGRSRLQFATGTINTIAGNEFILGPDAAIADSGQSGLSALGGLSSITGKLAVEDHVTLMTSAGLTISGVGAALAVDDNDRIGGSLVSIAGTVTLGFGAALWIGNGDLSDQTTVALGGLDNNGSVFLSGGTGGDDSRATLVVSGPVMGSATAQITGSVTIELGSSVASGQRFGLGQGGLVVLDDPGEFAGQVGLTVGSSTTTPISAIDLSTVPNGGIVSTTLDTRTDVIVVSTTDSSSIDIQMYPGYVPGTVVHHIVDAGGSGTELFLTSAGAARDDFNGDRTSDILLHSTANGEFVDWTMSGTGIGAAISAAQNLVFNGNTVALDPSWSVAGSGDFDGDGRSDILLQNTSGSFTDWAMNGATIAAAQGLSFNGAAVALDPSWSVAGAGDFTGDARADILLHNSGGSFALWAMSGAMITAAQNVTFNGAAVALDPSWSVAATGDFNGDGEADILLRNTNGQLVDWTMSGAAIVAAQNLTFGGAAVGIDSSWQLLGTGDFNGDGKADILLHNSANGGFVDWTMNGATITAAENLTFGGTPVKLDSSWTFADLGDYNGDGRTDIVLRSTTGSFTDWTMHGATIAAADSLTFNGSPVTLDNSWRTN